jgi:hypothetical protein
MVMKTILILLFAILLTSCSSCKKMNVCKDESLTLSRVEFTGKQLRIDGFYYGNPDTAWNNIVRFETFVFYANGILYQTGAEEYDKLESYIESLTKTSEQDIKYVWGVFNIENNVIKIEHWWPAQCGYPVILRTGEILNDTTFVLTKMERRDSQGTTHKDINQGFYFRQFNTKPDSTNNFIK